MVVEAVWETVSIVVVALSAIRLVTFNDPKLAPPVIPNEVPVALAKDSDPREVPPLTVRPVVVALLTEMFNADSEPRDDPPETVKPVVVAFCSEIPTPIIEEVALTEKRVEVAPCPKISNMLV